MRTLTIVYKFFLIKLGNQVTMKTQDRKKEKIKEERGIVVYFLWASTIFGLLFSIWNTFSDLYYTGKYD